jgi:hypothetical protein
MLKIKTSDPSTTSSSISTNTARIYGFKCGCFRKFSTRGRPNIMLHNDVTRLVRVNSDERVEVVERVNKT